MFTLVSNDDSEFKMDLRFKLMEATIESLVKVVFCFVLLFKSDI